MSYGYDRKLKIQFRAVPYTSDSLVLEWRINPNQDLTYYTEHHLWFIHWKRKHKYDTDWHQPIRFFNHLTAHYYDEDDRFNWFPYWIKDQNNLNWYKNNFKTVGEFFDYQQKDIAESKEKWRINRQNYLANHKIIY